MGLVTRGEVPTRMVALLPEELEADPEANLDLDENLEETSVTNSPGTKSPGPTQARDRS